MTLTEPRSAPPAAYVSRPRDIADLRLEQRRGVELLTLNTKELPADPNVLRMFAEIIERMDPTVYVRTDEYGKSVWSMRLSDDELAKALLDAQQEWERSRMQYEACLISGVEPEPGVRYRVDAFCRAESLPLPWVSA